MIVSATLPPNRDASGHLVPKHFLCPISCEVMADPVITEHGQTFDRRWIQAAIAEGHDTCPLTRRPFVTQALRPNTAVKAAIQAHPVAREEALLAARTPLPAMRTRRRAGATSNSNLGQSELAGDPAGGFLHLHGTREQRETFRATPQPMAPAQHPPLRQMRTGTPTPGLHRPLPPSCPETSNVAGRAHASLSRHNSRILLAELQLQARRIDLELREQGGSNDDTIRTRINLAGRIARRETSLRWADAAAPVTRVTDALLGTYKENGRSHVLRSRGAISTALAVAMGTPELPPVFAQPLSLLGAGVKGTVRLAALGPSMVAAGKARRAMRDQLEA